MLNRFFTTLGLWVLSLATYGCSSDILRTNGANGTGGVVSAGAGGNPGRILDSGPQSTGGNAATGGAIGAGEVFDGGGGLAVGGSPANGGASGFNDSGPADLPGTGGAGGSSAGRDSHSDLGMEASTHVDAGGVVDSAGTDGPFIAGTGGAGGGAGGRSTGSGGSGGVDGAGAGGSEVGRDTPSAGGAGGSGPQQPFTLSPQYIDLGNVLVGASVQTTVTVTAAQSLSNLWVSLLGIHLSQDPTSTCTTTLAAGASCTVVVNFIASVDGTTTDFISVSNAGQSLDVPVQAESQNPAKLVMDQSAVYFGATPGGTSTPATIRIANAGDIASGPLVAQVSGTGAASFSIVSNTCAAPLNPLGSCSVAVVFSPQVPDGGTVPPNTTTATLAVTDLGVSASVASAKLTGNVLWP